MKEEKGEDEELQVSLSMKELIDAQSSDTICSTLLKLIDVKVSLDKYCINDRWLLHKVVREDDK